MKAIGKILGLSILGLLLLIVTLGFALTHFFDPNDYKDEIRELARSKAGLELDIRGDIGWSLFPWLGLELHDTTLASARSPEQPLADLRMLGLSVRVMPLLRRELQMSDITLNGLHLTLTRDKNGTGNWEGIGQPPAQPEQPATEPIPTETKADEAPASTNSSARPLQLDIDSLTIHDARVTYSDAQNGQHLSAEGIELSTGAIREGTPTAIRLSAFFGSNKPVIRARTELQGSLLFDNRLRRYQLEDLRLNGEASGEPLQGKTLTFSAQGQLLADLSASTAQWNNLKFTANLLRGLGELKIAGLQTEPALSGSLTVAPFNLRELLEGLGQSLPEMSDPDTLSKAELVTRLNATTNSISLDDLTLKLDDSTFTGQVGISDFSRQALRIQLQGDKLNLDRYLPAAEKDGDAQARQNEVRATASAAIGNGSTPLPDKPTQPAWSDAKVLPTEALRTLDTRLELQIGSLQAKNLPMDDFRLKARSANGLLTLEELQAQLYNGRMEASASLDVRPALPQLSAQARLVNLPVERLLQSQGEQVVVKGQLTLDSDIRTQGNTQKAWIDHLDGKAGFVLDNGILVDANLEQQLCRAIATLNRKPLTSEPRARDTAFRELKGNLTLRSGVANNPDLKASIPGLTINGNGDLDLRVLGMDYRIGLIIEGDKGEMPDPACAVNERYVGIEWPLRCRGPLELGAKACRFDNDGLGKIAARLAGEKLSEKIEEKLGDKVSPDLKDAIRGLFSR